MKLEREDIENVWVYGDGGFARTVTDFLKGEGVHIVGYITKTGFQVDGVNGDRSLYDNNRLPVVIGVFNHKDDPVEIIEFLEDINVAVSYTHLTLPTKRIV